MNDQPIKLTAFEYTIMETLIRNRGKVVSKDSLMLQLYPDAELRESHTIDVLMGRLRKKIQAEYPQDVITTVRGRAICSNCADEGTVAAYLPTVITGSLPAGDRRVVLVLSYGMVAPVGYSVSFDKTTFRLLRGESNLYMLARWENGAIDVDIRKT